MAKTKKIENPVDLIKDNITYDSKLETCNNILKNCINQQTKFDKIDEVCEIIAGCKITKQDYYINVLCKNHNLPKGTFKTILKHYTKAIADVENEETNEPRVDRIEKFLTKHYLLRYNLVSQNMEYIPKETNDNNWIFFNEFTIPNIVRKMRKTHFTISKQELEETIYSDFTPHFNPFLDYFESLPEYDNIDHIANLCSYVTTPEPEYFYKHLKKHLVRCISCSLGGDFNKQIFTLIGDGNETQNIGKTTFIRFLLPTEFKDYINEHPDIKTKDGYIALTNNFMINLDEMDKFNKQDIAEIKSFVSTDTVKVRIPFARRPVTIKRLASFFGSSNQTKILTDLTGNVRYICISIRGINFDYSTKIDINKVWAQAYYLYKDKSFSSQLTTLEVRENEQHNDKFMILPTEFEILQKYFVISSKEIEREEIEQNTISDNNTKFLTTSEICKLINDITLGAVRLNIIAVGRALRKLGYIQEDKYHTNSNYAVKGYYLKFYPNGIDLQVRPVEPELTIKN